MAVLVVQDIFIFFPVNEEEEEEEEDITTTMQLSAAMQQSCTCGPRHLFIFFQ